MSLNGFVADRNDKSMLIAVTRAVSATFAECELTHRPRDPINVANAIAEHARYEEALRSLGATVVRASPEPALPDAVFVEDTALALDEVAVITRPGALTRRREVESMAQVLSAYKPLLRIQPPGTLDGGDVLRVGRKLYVGLSSRSNHEGISQLETLLEKWDYEVIRVQVEGCLHLKSAVTQVGEDLLLINPNFVPPACFRSTESIPVAPAEADGANALWIGRAGAIIYAAHHPETAERLERAGVRVVAVPSTELAKAEGGVTCCSVLFETVP
ncbi:MAG: dimethylarginine dimethylaminohydrolase family protein [Gemmatimonadales bacterium]